MFRRALAAAALRVPLSSPMACMAGTVLFLFGGGWAIPRLPRWANDAPVVHQALAASAAAREAAVLATWALQGAAAMGAALFQARCLQLCFPGYFDTGGGAGFGWRRNRSGAPLKLAGMAVAEDELMTSILVTGVTGSSKTAGILLPALEQLLQAYRGEGGREKFGAFIPEVKGDLVDAAIYLADRAGRCVSREVAILTPSCRVPVVRYRDERGRTWFLSGRGGAGGSDAGDLLPPLVFPAAHPAAGRPVAPDVLENAADCATLLPSWKQHRIVLSDGAPDSAAPGTIRRPGLEPRFIGWRWADGRLLRVACTRAGGAEFALNADRAPVSCEPPRMLAVDGIEFVDNGVHYNLIDARLPAAEAAERLTKLVAMARGTASRGDNEYFYEQGRKLIAACIALHRATSCAPATAVDVARLATRDEPLAEALAALESRLAREPADPDGGDSQALHALRAFFRDEWQRMVADGKTANVIKSTISAALDPFLRDPRLQETFCRPSTVSFESLAQEGCIIALVPGDRYEQLGRILGAACKMDFQSVMLGRTSRPDLNRTRLVVYFADECHKYATSGSASTGDPYFMNLSRSNRVANLCATQSYAWLVEVLGRDAANVYISAFGVQFWLQQTDPETCRRAAEVCGTFTRDKLTTDHELNFGGLVSTLGDGRAMTIRHRRFEEEGPRFRPEDFALLDVGEVIAYNKGRPGRYGKVRRGRVRYLSCLRPPAGMERIQRRMREYYRERLENLAFDRGEFSRWDAEPAAVGEPARDRAELAAYVADADDGPSAEAAERWWRAEAGISSDDSP